MPELEPGDPQVRRQEPRKRRLLFAGLGAAGILILVAATCALRRDSGMPEPERLKQKVNAMVKNLIQDRWNAMRTAVDQMGTDEGARAFFAANPGLAPRIRNEAAFLAAARSWRRLLQPLPENLPDLETRDLSYVQNEGGTEMSYRTPKGTRIFMRWAADDRLVEVRVY